MAEKKNTGEELIAAMEEALAYRREENRREAGGDPSEGPAWFDEVRVDRLPVTAREARVAPPPKYQGAEVLRIRKRLGCSQAIFAQLLNVSAETVRSWEQGRREPDGPTLRLLQVADRNPRALLVTTG
ncbi:MAG TPA: helix-turn-helix domain-containing protein [Longimicrobium sp.]|nr:helix-turn-helix domain-containing protein [Longimicrobium sp.]